MNSEHSSSERPGLVRGLGPLEATTLLIGGTIGASIFLVPADVARQVGAPGLALGVWLLTGLLAVCGALSFAELASAIPETGGTYAFLNRAYPRTPIAFLFAWMMLFTWSTGATAVTATMAAIYFGQFAERFVDYGPGAIKAVAVTTIITLAAVNYIGVRQGGRVQNVLTALKVGGLVLIAGLCLASSVGEASRLLPVAPPDATPTSMVSGVGTAMILTIFSYSGWYFVTHVAGEVREPAKNVPKAIALGIGAVILCYVTVNVAFLYVLPFDVLQNSPRVGAAAVEAVVGPTGGDIVALAVMLSALGAVNAQMLNYPRLPFRLASDGLFFSGVGRVHPRFRTPGVAIVLVAVLASAYAVSGTYEDVLTYISFSGQTFMALTVAALFVLRRREQDLARPYRVWGYPVVPGLYLAILVWYLGNLLVTRLEHSLVGIALTLAGLPFLWIWKRRQR